MELLMALAMKFWQWSLLIALVIVGLIINLLDRRKSNCTFHYEELPHLQPIPIKTKGKGFWKGIVMRSEERRVGKECRSRWSPYH